MVLTSNVIRKSELDGMWKEMVMASLRNYLSTHPSWRIEQKKPVRTECVRRDSTVNTRPKCCFFLADLLYLTPLTQSRAILGLSEVRKPNVNMRNLDPLKSS